jgi:hypothetical protein
MSAAAFKPKAVRDGYAPAPFFFHDVSANGSRRLVAWTGDLGQLTAVFRDIIRILPGQVDILLKFENAADEAITNWNTFLGSVDRTSLLRAIAQHDALIFRDSRTQLMIRNPTTKESVVLDETGVMYLYSDSQLFRQPLVGAGLIEGVHELIGAGEHWRHCVENSATHLGLFVNELGLLAVDDDGVPLPQQHRRTH